MLDALMILATIGNILGIIFFIMPAFMMIETWKTKETQKVPYFLFIFTTLNCEFWMIYGIIKQKMAIYLGNAFGVITNHFYVLIFIICLNTSSFKKISYSSFFLVCSMINIICFQYYFNNEELLGSIACTMNICMFFSQLQKIIEVFKYKDNSYIPMGISVCIAFSSSIWTTYGILTNDKFVIIPNIIGIVLSLFQIVLFFIFKNKSKKYNKFQKEPENAEIFKNVQMA